MTAAPTLFDPGPSDPALPAPTMHTLIPTADDAEQTIRDRCAAAGHQPATTHNPWLDETFCACGAARHPGDHRPWHAPSCFDVGCAPDCPAARASFGWLAVVTAETGPAHDRRTVRRLDRVRTAPATTDTETGTAPEHPEEGR